MKRSFATLMFLLALLAIASPFAYAQGGVTTSLTGTVMDASAGTIPGATVVVKNTGTGTTHNAVTNTQGTFVIPAISPGTYSVTVSLTGFKTAVLNDIVVNAGVPASVRVTLALGGVSETVVVDAASPIVQTVESGVSATINVKQIESLPLTSRNVLDFVTFLPGVQTPGGNRDSQINGLPQSAINITLDGINVQDNTLKTTDGFFTIVQPRLDAIEEVTVSSAAQGADGAGQGAIQIRFVTRSGTNTYTGSGYNYFRSDKLNANTWFNIRNNVNKAKLKQNQTGVRFGGPVKIPGLYDGSGKLFFFFNIEEFRQPSDVSRTRTILHPRAEQGWFRYGGTEVNVLAVAAANGQTATMDPTILKLLADIRTATGTSGTVTDAVDPRFQDYNYNVPVSQLNRFPTVRIDLNVTPAHRWSTTFNFHTFSSVPDTLNGFEPAFPGFPVMGSQTSKRVQLANTLRSTLGSNVVNEARVGYSGAPVEFFKEQFDAGLWSGSLANQLGHQLNISAAGISNASPAPNAQSRNASTLLIEDTLSWQRGSHSFSFGGSMTFADVWMKNQATVPTVSFGVDTSDPANSMFNSTNFTGAAQTDLDRARALYAVLTGRITQIQATARIDESSGEYVYSGLGIQRGRMPDAGFFAQDSWRVKPDLTINFGLRYELQLPFHATNSSYSMATIDDVWGISGNLPGCNPSAVTPATCNLFKSGTTPGITPKFVQLGEGVNAYQTDLNNWAPSAGFNWAPSVQSGLLRKVMGQPGDFAIRGGFARSYQRNGLNDFTGFFNQNPGVAISVTRSQGIGNLGTLPQLLRDPASLAPASFPSKPNYPLTDVITQDVSAFDPNLQVPYADTYTIGVQRGLTRTMAIEVRYVGTRSREQISTYNLNELNINENGFLNEFRLAQANLLSHISAGCGITGQPACSFAYRGPGTGTSPLPTYLAYLNGSRDTGNAAAYAGGNWTNATFINPLARLNPQPFTAINSLDDDAGRRANAIAAGIPRNYILANPDYLGGANIRGNGGYSSFNGVQVELRRRLSNGLQFQTSYAYGPTWDSTFYSFRVPRKTVRQSGGEGEVTHAFKLNWVFELPFGQGKRWGSDAGAVMDRIIGGWQFHGNLRVQSGRLVDFGNVRMVGFGEKELWNDLYKLRIDSNRRVWMLPEAVVDETIKAFSISATSATGYGALGAPSGKYFAPANASDCLETISNNYGECGTRSLIMRGPMFKEVDMSVMKVVPIAGRTRYEFRIEALNVFNSVNYVPVTGIGSTRGNFEVSALTGTNTSRIVQIVNRITW
jgi:carboxypeptidase family protein/TonB-dependent receptor-like protein